MAVEFNSGDRVKCVVGHNYKDKDDDKKSRKVDLDEIGTVKKPVADGVSVTWDSDNKSTVVKITQISKI